MSSSFSTADSRISTSARRFESSVTFNSETGNFEKLENYSVDGLWYEIALWWKRKRRSGVGIDYQDPDRVSSPLIFRLSPLLGLYLT